MNKKLKLAIVVSHPIQYFVPIYKLLARSDSIELIVIYYSDAGARTYYDSQFEKEIQWDIDLLGGYKYEILEKGKPVGKDRSFWEIDSKKLESVFDKFKPDAVVLNGYSQRLQWRAWQWARKHNSTLLYISDSNLKNKSRKIWRKAFKILPVRFFFRYIDIYLCTSDENARYIKHYGGNERKIVRSPTCGVDLKRFPLHEKHRVSSARQQIRSRFNINNNEFVILFTAKLITLKRPKDLVEASLILRSCGHNIVSIFVGSGPQENELKRIVSQSSTPEACRFVGFVNQKEIVDFYFAADYFVLPSEYEALGVSAVEAAASGLPLILSDQVGCIGPTSAARVGENALVFPQGNVNALKDCIIKLMESPEEAQKMGEASREIAKTQNISVAAAAIEKAVLEYRDGVFRNNDQT